MPLVIARVVMSRPKRRRAEPLTESAELRIIGGQFRGRKLRHEPFRMDDNELVTRPMKHRLRETIFNLVSTEAEGRHAIDLFAGTGALGLEALSRGAAHATFIERHVPTARVIEENVASLGVEGRSTVLVMSAFLWGKRDAAGAADAGGAEGGGSQTPWLVFCSPPYAFFVDRRDEMRALIASVTHAAPVGSIVVVESDERFDFAELPDEGGESWDVRTYPPAVVGVWRKQS
jgi:16S rRNA (guanine966-N2)-methyltransferase